LDGARRPILLIGAGVIAAGASEQVRALAERTSTPVASTLLGLGAMPAGHPLALGMVGMHGAPYVNLLLEECDLLLAIGMRFDDRATGKAAAFCPNARIVHVDIDASELGKIKTPLLAVRADASRALDELLPQVAPKRRRAWRARVDALRASAPLAMPDLDDPTTPYGIVRAAAELAGDDAIVTTDVGQHQMWVAQAYPFRRPRQCLTSGGLGTMGFGLPAAIGAALAAPGRPVLCFTGDGSLLMNLQELATAAEEGVNVKILLLNNGHLGLVRQQQQLFYGGRYQASRFHAEPDFAALARAFGMSATRLDDSAGDPREALATALATPGPCLVEVPIAREQNVYPMVPPGAANRDMLIAGESHAHAAA
ncbi:acetolactate synthase large subunit, partial [Candidatus Binatia bacterium]|nr:acetolactate synthase large subunit [Candidatus Binatia bacterium]